MTVEGGGVALRNKKCNVSLSERGVRAEMQRSFQYIILTRAVASQREHLYTLITFFCYLDLVLHSFLFIKAWQHVYNHILLKKQDLTLTFFVVGVSEKLVTV